MRTFDDLHARRTKVAPPTKVEERLPISQSIAVIAVLSALSWGIVVLVIAALRAAI